MKHTFVITLEYVKLTLNKLKNNIFKQFFSKNLIIVI